jgi:hypothetical protein
VLAIQLRAQEHKEEGVLRLGSIVGEIEPRMQMWLWQLKNTPQQVNPGQTEPSLWVTCLPWRPAAGRDRVHRVTSYWENDS